MPTLIDEEELHQSFADVALSEEEDDGPVPPRKRVRLEHAHPDSRGLSSDNSAGPIIDLITPSDDEAEFANHGLVNSGNKQLDGFQASPACRLANFYIRPSHSNYPKSLYEGWHPPMPRTPEHLALSQLLREYRAQKVETSCGISDKYVMFKLRDFRIYRPTALSENKFKANRQYELQGLHHLKIDMGCDCLLFDGIISTGNLQSYVEGVPFETLAIDGYGDTTIHSIGQGISIQSQSAATRNVWYLLETPSSEYLPYHRPFLWVADFAKHAIDYFAEHENVPLDHFRSQFYDWINKHHCQDEAFQKWLSDFGRSDFRQVVVTNARYLWKETWDVVEGSHNDPLWEDINYVSNLEPEITGSGKTLVTPYVFKSFQHISTLTRFFEIHEPTDNYMVAAWESRVNSLGFVDAQHAQDQACHGSVTRENIKRHDFVVVRPDEETTWKDGSQVWYAYVQNIRKDRRGTTFDVIWLYPPSATTLAGGMYPYKNELFFSSHCNCDEAPLNAQDIIGKVNICWLRSGFSKEKVASENFQYFIRQKYEAEKHCFSTLHKSDFTCSCMRQQSAFEKVMSKLAAGDTFLIPFNRSGLPSLKCFDEYEYSDTVSDSLEPVVLDKFLPHAEKLSVRRLIRRGKRFHDSQAMSNELVWTDDFLEVSPVIVGPRCSIRFFQDQDRVPPPYNRNGTGNCWIITMRLNHEGELEKLQPPYPTSMNEGLDPTAHPPRPKMVGLDSFAGGGNFGRGLEEGGAVQFIYAIDWAKNAVLTYKANHNSEQKCWVYWGSVNDYLKRVMDGDKDYHFAKIGDIDFIAAGSPCQGFSGLQRNKASDSSLRNISMVASVAAYVDSYRPKYALLENVVAMAHRGKERLGIFPQLLCTLVGLGYQVSQHYLDAWSFGDPQRRSRLFVSIAAPGLVPMPPPTLTHSHPPGTATSALGKNLANDLRFGERRFDLTPFQYASVEQRMGDLPEVGDSHVQTCIPYPDHRTVSTEAAWVRDLIKHIPIHPPGQGVMDAIESEVMPDPLANRFLSNSGELKTRRGSSSWSRIPRHGLTNTITTAPAGSCAINGRILHWQQHRVLTIREARRAQGFDEDDVIIGSATEQWKIIGNSVSRSVALGLGIALQEAWLANPPDPPPAPGGANEMEHDPVVKESPESSPIETPVVKQRQQIIVTPSITTQKQATTEETSTAVRTRDIQQVTATMTVEKTTGTPIPKPQPKQVHAVVVDLTGDD